MNLLFSEILLNVRNLKNFIYEPQKSENIDIKDQIPASFGQLMALQLSFGSTRNPLLSCFLLSGCLLQQSYCQSHELSF
ncbi:unnamed protein product [Blepharisma stoltei]|uniref:Uncharacterized protein n=1 Tax=Blepharisma stoltei TaxID=1481888 RepID=A0AAU9I8P3_9CILI|nr:unnamed protein product [Blepharisma stoltei]